MRETYYSFGWYILNTNIPQEEGIERVCKVYETFHNIDPPILTRYLREMPGVILTENAFEFNEKNSKPMVSQWALRQQCLFANIFMAEIETTLMQQTIPSQENGKVTLMTFSPFETVKETKWIVSLNKLTHSTQQ